MTKSLATMATRRRVLRSLAAVAGSGTIAFLGLSQRQEASASPCTDTCTGLPRDERRDCLRACADAVRAEAQAEAEARRAEAQALRDCAGDASRLCYGQTVTCCAPNETCAGGACVPQAEPTTTTQPPPDPTTTTTIEPATTTTSAPEQCSGCLTRDDCSAGEVCEYTTGSLGATWCNACESEVGGYCDGQYLFCCPGLICDLGTFQCMSMPSGTCFCHTDACVTDADCCEGLVCKDTAINEADRHSELCYGRTCEPVEPGTAFPNCRWCGMHGVSCA
jgi:hypothetical protein